MNKRIVSPAPIAFVAAWAGLAGLVGLFSTMAVNKLRRMAIELLGPLEQEEDPLREESKNGK